ncbi:hypothetical protein N0B31_16380 [Salinirubellus salinus]|jgi:CDP-diglyceride synthetase|uniref:Uncharacterized protein n=1 Tax=Salinirubellus salinus TaxID=1364945 RepID=A0A9E7UA75_9EURY|nr:hypothetical protein [Salinirubellus salinus]UWM53702.1 hypothetical protein N0B31_16380 [Salinirubellus salinus]
MATADSETSPRLTPEGLLAGFAVGVTFALVVWFLTGDLVPWLPVGLGMGVALGVAFSERLG